MRIGKFGRYGNSRNAVRFVVFRICLVDKCTEVLVEFLNSQEELRAQSQRQRMSTSNKYTCPECDREFLYHASKSGTGVPCPSCSRPIDLPPGLPVVRQRQELSVSRQSTEVVPFKQVRTPVDPKKIIWIASGAVVFLAIVVVTMWLDGLDEVERERAVSNVATFVILVGSFVMIVFAVRSYLRTEFMRPSVAMNPIRHRKNTNVGLPATGQSQIRPLPFQHLAWVTVVVVFSLILAIWLSGRGGRWHSIPNSGSPNYLENSSSIGGRVWVNGYHRKDGTYVRGHYRSR